MFGSAESERPTLTNGEIIFEEFQPICDHNPPTSQTDRRTDGWTDDKTALCTKVHRVVKKRTTNQVINQDRKEKKSH